MTEQRTGQATRAAQAGAGQAGRTGQGLGDGLGSLVAGLPTDRLREEAQNLLSAFGERAVATLVDKVEGATGRLTEFAEHGGDGAGLKAALSEGRALLEGKSPLKALVSAGLGGAGGGLGQIKDKAVQALTGGKGGRRDEKNKKIKVTNIIEDIDVGVPVSVAYNQWTQFEDFPTFMKKVEDVSRDSDSETELDWKAQVFWSHRRWHSTVVEQVPDERIVWTSKGEKGHVDGAVTFHEVTPDLTRILLVLQYHPQGFFERTGNIWRAQGRRARLELKHFRRHVMTQTVLDPEAVEGWRGEVHDGEVVRSDEEVREEEERRGEAPEGGEPGGRPDEEGFPEDEHPDEEGFDDEEYGAEDRDEDAFDEEEEDEEEEGDDVEAGETGYHDVDEDDEVGDYDDQDLGDEDDAGEDEEPARPRARSGAKGGGRR